MLNRTHDTVLEAPYNVTTDKLDFPHRQMTQRELRITSDIEDRLTDFFKEQQAAVLNQAQGVENVPADWAALHDLILDREAAALFVGFQAGQVDGFRLACRLLTRMLSGKVEEFHKVTAEQLPWILCGALTDDDQASDLIGKIVTGQL